jgi:D-xylose 1-dehydrogenase (NADP+, D-xylono-1,5-lactone-forming)
MDKSIRWGIIGTAKIAETAVIPAIKASRNGTVYAVASRDEWKARAYADRLGIERAYGSYEALLADPDIDAIYNPLPNDGHAPWSIQAAKAKKPTLCEKPIALNAQQAQEMVEVFRQENVLLAEAFMYRYHPQHAAVKKLLADNTIGPLRLIDVCFTYAMSEAETKNVRLKPELGGGGLMDVGCYCVNLCRMIVGEEPDFVTAQSIYGAQTQVDEMFVGTLHFPGGVVAHFDCGMRATFRNHYTLVGPDGEIQSDLAFRPPDSGSTTLQVRRAGQIPETITIPDSNQYVLMVEDFADAVIAGRKTTYDPADSVKNMRVLDALDRAARENKVVAV